MVTGASSGIGAAFARALTLRGYSVVLVARRRDRLEKLAAEIGGGSEVLPADLVDDEQLRLVESRVASDPHFSLLVNNAGFGIQGKFSDADVNDHERMHRLHVTAPLRLTHAALRNMVPRDGGSVINVSSVAGFTSSPGSVSYNATKHWMNNFTEGIYLDLRTRGSQVRVQALCPGFTYSEFHDVMPMDRSLIPRSLWSTAEQVVAASLAGLDRGDLFVVPGWQYKAVVAALKLLPSALVRAGSVHMARRMKRT
ncbi:MAG TPA: SDR family oxidoreductase [Bryobacteraceae bacterium]|nr:SDR family oxidoreductase [Bryobacteraceae bacterium]